MTSINRINQAIPSISFNSSDRKKSDRRRSIDQQQQQHNKHYEHPKQLQHDQLSPKTESESEAQTFEYGDSHNEDNENQQSHKKAVASLGPYDVICGRGSVAFNNIGNRRFRILISMNTDRYSNCENRYRKGRFIGDLVHTFQHEIGARFFKMQDDQLIQLPERQIRQKVGHALRDVLAFQENQNQHRQQLREQQTIESKNFRKSPSITKLKQRIIGKTTAISRSQTALSSIRSRLTELRLETDAIRLQNRNFLPPLSTASLEPDSSQTAFAQNSSHALDCPNRDGTRSQGLTTASRPSTILAAKNFSQKPNYFPLSTSMEGRTVSVTASSQPYRHDLRNEMGQKNCLWSDDKDTASEKHFSNTNKTNCYHDSHKDISTFNHRHSNIDDSFEDDDFTPIPIGEHEEENNEKIEIFQF